MKTQASSELINQERRQLLSTTAMGITAAGLASLLPVHPTLAAASGAIRPFRINVPERGQAARLRKMPAR
jgi:hypothetical protein